MATMMDVERVSGRMVKSLASRGLVVDREVAWGLVGDALDAVCMAVSAGAPDMEEVESWYEDEEK